MQLQDLPLWKRELALSQLGYLRDVPQPSLCIVWEDPANLDAPAKVTTPSPQWLKMATLGGVLPEVGAYHDSRLCIELSNGRRYENVTFIEAQDLRLFAKEAGHSVREERVTSYPVHAAPVVSSMTEEEALEYLVQKDVPYRVWGEANFANKPRHVIAKRENLPNRRFVRNAWTLSGNPDAPVHVDMELAKEIFRRRVANLYLGKKDRLMREREVALLTGEPIDAKLRELEQIDLAGLRRASGRVKSADELEALVPECLAE